MKQGQDIADFFYSQNNHQPKIGLPLKKWILVFDASLTSSSVDMSWGNRKFENYLQDIWHNYSFWNFDVQFSKLVLFLFLFCHAATSYELCSLTRFRTQAPCIWKSPAIPFCMVETSQKLLCQLGLFLLFWVTVMVNRYMASWIIFIQLLAQCFLI